MDEQLRQQFLAWLDAFAAWQASVDAQLRALEAAIERRNYVKNPTE